MVNQSVTEWELTWLTGPIDCHWLPGAVEQSVTNRAFCYSPSIRGHRMDFFHPAIIMDIFFHGLLFLRNCMSVICLTTPIYLRKIFVRWCTQSLLHVSIGSKHLNYFWTSAYSGLFEFDPLTDVFDTAARSWYTSSRIRLWSLIYYLFLVNQRLSWLMLCRDLVLRYIGLNKCPGKSSTVIF